MSLPLLVSVPHGGLEIPPEVAAINLLTPRQIAEDGDEGAAAIYAIDGEVDGYVTTSVARAFVDQNRSEDDRRKDGVVKTHTCWDVPIYREPLSDDLVERLLDRYHRPYHRALSERAAAGGVRLGVDAHTMAAFGPPVGPDPGRERPAACLGNGDGTCPREWLESLATCLERALERPVAMNDPFRGGHVIRAHASELPWVQLELSRAPYLSEAQKRERVLTALSDWCRSRAV